MIPYRTQSPQPTQCHKTKQPLHTSISSSLRVSHLRIGARSGARKSCPHVQRQAAHGAFTAIYVQRATLAHETERARGPRPARNRELLHVLQHAREPHASSSTRASRTICPAVSRRCTVRSGGAPAPASTSASALAPPAPAPAPMTCHERSSVNLPRSCTPRRSAGVCESTSCG
jgi:hypothetical protein